MNSGTLAPVFCLTLVVGLISLACQIYVSRILSKAGGKVEIPIGKRSWMTPFIMGWQNSKKLQIVDVMIFWSIILSVTFVGIMTTVLAALVAIRSS